MHIKVTIDQAHRVMFVAIRSKGRLNGEDPAPPGDFVSFPTMNVTVYVVVVL